jgi:hypothetical protein
VNTFGLLGKKSVGPESYYAEAATAYPPQTKLLSAGRYAMAALGPTGSVSALGMTNQGILGNGITNGAVGPLNTNLRVTAEPIPFADDASAVTDIAFGDFTAVSLHETGRVFVWGLNSKGVAGRDPAAAGAGASVQCDLPSRQKEYCELSPREIAWQILKP